MQGLLLVLLPTWQQPLLEQIVMATAGSHRHSARKLRRQHQQQHLSLPPSRCARTTLLVDCDGSQPVATWVKAAGPQHLLDLLMAPWIRKKTMAMRRHLQLQLKILSV